VGAGPWSAAPAEELIDPAVADLASTKGLSVAEATRRIGWQERAADLAEAVEASVDPARCTLVASLRTPAIDGQASSGHVFAGCGGHDRNECGSDIITR
jgi:hypothetical protein